MPDLIIAPFQPDPMQEAESALKAVREARDREAKQQATRALERAVQRLKDQEGPPKKQPPK